MFKLLIVMAMCLGAVHATEEPKGKPGYDREVLKVRNAFANLPSPACSPYISADATMYKQNNAPITAVIEHILLNGKTLVDIELTCADDALMVAILENCPNLKAFSINQRIDTWMQKFTPVGLKTLAAFPQLDKLVLNIWEDLFISIGSMNDVLNAQQNLVDLTLITCFVDDKALDIIAKYTKLNKLSIITISNVTKGLEALVQSTTLKSSLSSLELNMIMDLFGKIAFFTDSFFQNLSQFTQLTDIALHGDWKASDVNVQAFLTAQTGLTSVDFLGLNMNLDLAKSIGSLTQLTKLHLYNCAKLDQKDYHILLEGLSNLQELHFSQCDGFADENFNAIVKMPLRKLALVGCSYVFDQGLNILCKSNNMQQTLEELEISGAEFTDSIFFGQIAKLKLNTLRIEKCPLFNDTSMKMLINGPFADSIQAIEFDHVSISDAMAPNFAFFKNLNTLMIANCGAITIDGVKTLLQSKPLLKNITRLYLANLVITKQMIPLFGKFRNIEMLVIGNPDQLDLFSQASDGFFNLPNIKKNNAQLELFVGMLEKWKVITRD